MAPVPYVERLEKYLPRLGFPAYQWAVSDVTPWTPFIKSLSMSRVALISSAGVHRKDQAPFDTKKDDLSFREIPKDVNPGDLMISHGSYDEEGAKKDINCVLPIQRLLELEMEGYIGELYSKFYTFRGTLWSKTRTLKVLAPALIQKLKDAQVDAALLVPIWPFCHQAVGLLARAIEEAGIPTTSISSARDITSLVKPPRAVFLNFPLGYQTGRPYEPELQTKIVKDALNALISIKEPGTILDLPYDWPEGRDWESKAYVVG